MYKDTKTGFTADEGRDGTEYTLNATLKGDGVREPQVERISGTDIAGNPYEAVQHIVEIMRNTHIEPHMLKDFNTFEQTIVAVMVRQFHLMVRKQRGYGTKNISALKARGVLKRIEEKVLRGYEEIGDPDEQIERAKALDAALPDDANINELLEFASNIHKILNPTENSDEENSVDNMALDISNLGEILYVVLFDAWGHPLEERLPEGASVLPE